MLAIRLSRTGKRHQPHYRIVVCEVRSKRDSRTIDQIGHWQPKEGKVVLNRNLYVEWQEKGAQPTLAVRKLFNAKTS